ncbi:MAG: ABC transporter ATP-binding protein [Propionibacteriaceae bacterium]|jgi:ABC-type lipoprotein export system ATPase subunit|nr:ABC transporter ATP-binding protein [Propionibacteriaceae bacterium]
MADLLKVERLSKTYAARSGQVQALTDVWLELAPGELVAVVGPSGSGKSTLLNVVGDILPASAGRVLLQGQALGGRDAARAARRNASFGCLFQDFALIERATASVNVELPLRYAAGRIGRRARRERGQAALAAVGIADLGPRRVDQLSGGQRQRVALARALVSDPPILLADEPTGALDSQNGDLVFDLLRQQASAGRGVLVSTHNLDLALSCDRVVALRDGRVVDGVDLLPRRGQPRRSSPTDD